jgi:hypothetical protein
VSSTKSSYLVCGGAPPWHLVRPMLKQFRCDSSLTLRVGSAAIPTAARHEFCSALYTGVNTCGPSSQIYSCLDRRQAFQLQTLFLLSKNRVDRIRRRINEARLS